ncbi:MAG TPA: bacteriorhodopsin [Motilibacteraceae bacterium]|nr:bacteriorhodopsin [Motilibacteraceae bacterium]
MESHLTYSQGEWDLILAAFVTALFAMIAGFVYFISSRNEIGSRYRPAATVSALVVGVATLAYVVLALSWITGFSLHGDTYTMSDSALQFRNGYRYVDWAVTVPMLCIELIGVCALTGARARTTRFWWMVLAELMVVTGYLGADTFGWGHNVAARAWWGLVSTIPFVVLYGWILKEVRASKKALPEAAGTSLMNAGWILALTWGVYPLAYLVPMFFYDSVGWGIARQLAFTAADVLAKVGFGVLIHKVAKLRTAADVRAGEETHPEPIWISGELVAPARPAGAEALAGLLAHSGVLDLRGERTAASSNGLSTGLSNGATGSERADGTPGLR